MEKSTIKTLLQIGSLFNLILCIALSIYGYRKGIFTSQESLQAYIYGFGKMGALLFIFFQTVQVVIPIIPGGLGCLGGVLLFGALRGFIYNYIGICIGSLTAFGIARHCGKPVLHTLFPKNIIEKYEEWTGEKGHFAKIFAIAIFFPIAPDDFLCYLAGTTEMSWKRFSTVIILCKPFAIAIYSLGLSVVAQRLFALIG